MPPKHLLLIAMWQPLIGRHSTTTWTEFCHFTEWTVFIPWVWTKKIFFDPLPPSPSCLRSYWMPPRLMDRSDPEVLRHYNKSARKALDRAREPYSDKVLALCKSGFDSVHSFWVMIIEWQGYSFHFCTYSFKICPTLE